MQISRHWRLNSLRYRLQGVRYENGKVSLQSRPLTLNEEKSPAPVIPTAQDERTTAVVAAAIA